jgi:hypothetical protein
MSILSHFSARKKMAKISSFSIGALKCGRMNAVYGRSEMVKSHPIPSLTEINSDQSDFLRLFFRLLGRSPRIHNGRRGIFICCL